MKNRLQIGGGKKRLLTALSLSLVVGNALFAQEAWIDVTSEHIVNPSFKDGGTGWSGSNYSANGWDVAEFYDKNGTCSQQINSLKPGSSYKLTVKAFYRFGVNDGGTAHDNGTEVIHSELFAGEQSVLLKSLYSEEKDPDLRNNRNGWPDGKEGTNLYFNKYPDRYVNELEFTVSEGVNFVNIGIRVSEKVSRDWTCFSDFKLYVKSTYTEALTEKIGLVENLLGENSVLAACLKVKAEVNDKLNTYKSYGAITQESVMVAAIDDLNGTIVKLNSLIEKATISNDAMVNASAVKERDMLEVLKNSLGTEISAMENCLKDFSLEDDIVKIDAQTDKLNKETLRVKAWMGMASVLTKTRNLANEIGGLQDDQTYIKVGEDLQNGNLDFYTMSADVEALNLVCRNAMTTDFLAKATSEAPIDMTSFIKNPNVYQAKDKTVVPDGWVIADWGSKDNKEPTTEGFADAELHCGSWSGNNDNSIGKAHYYSEIGGTVNVPDGCYRLEAATYITRQPDAVVLYASTDNVDMVMANFNGNKAVYDQAVGLNDGTTTSLEVQVSGGRLYFGVKGKAIVGGNGQQWLADNFRLYYIGAPDVEPKDIKVSEAGMSTYYSANAFTVPEGLTGGVVTNEDAATVAVDWRYPAGSTVPGRTGVILKGAVGDYKAEYSVANVASPENNLLDGTIEAATIADAGYKYYKLADGEKGLGFYFAVEGGSSIMNGANKAYLALPENEAQEVNFLALDFGTTRITDTALAAEDVRVDVYSISGVLVRSGVKASEALDGLSKGIYIVNGKKILK
jgi:alpha-amylase